MESLRFFCCFSFGGMCFLFMFIVLFFFMFVCVRTLGMEQLMIYFQITVSSRVTDC